MSVTENDRNDAQVLVNLPGDGAFRSLKDYCRHDNAPATVIAVAVGGAEPQG